MANRHDYFGQEDDTDGRMSALPPISPEDGKKILEMYCENSPDGRSDFMAGDKLLNAGLIDLGIHFLESALAKGWRPAAGRLGRFFYVMPRNPEDKTRGLQLLKESADEDDPESMAFLGNIYLFEKEVEGSEDEGVRLIRDAASQGDKLGMHTLGLMLLDGRKVNRNPEEGVKWICRAAEAGDVSSMKKLGNIYELGLGVEADEDLSMEWMGKASDAGDPDAMFVMGMREITGVGMDNDVDKGLSLLKEASDKGCEFAHYMLGRSYKMGMLVPQSDELSQEYYSRMSNRKAYEYLLNSGRISNMEIDSDILENLMKEYENNPENDCDYDTDGFGEDDLDTDWPDDDVYDDDEFDEEYPGVYCMYRVTVWLMDGSKIIKDFQCREMAVDAVNCMNLVEARKNGVLHINSNRVTSQINTDNIISIDIEPSSIENAYFVWTHIRRGF